MFKQIVLYRWINILLKILERYNLNLNRLSWNLFIEMEKTATSYFPPSCFILVLLKKWLILNCELVTDHSNIRSFLFIKLYRNPIIVYWNFTNYFNSYWELNLKCTSKKNKCKSKHWLALYVMYIYIYICFYITKKVLVVHFFLTPTNFRLNAGHYYLLPQSSDILP